MFKSTHDLHGPVTRTNVLATIVSGKSTKRAPPISIDQNQVENQMSWGEALLLLMHEEEC